MTIKFLSRAESLLVDLRPNLWPGAIFCTISPNANTKHRVVRTINNKVKIVLLAYKCLKPKEQYDYCIKMVKQCYVDYGDNTKILGTYEFNKSGLIHVHFIMSDTYFMQSNGTPSPKKLVVLRADVSNNGEVMRNKHRDNSPDMMNNIVYVNDSVKDRFNYFSKDSDDEVDGLTFFASNI